MDKKTEMESKAVKVISNVLATAIKNEPSLKESLSAVSLTPYTFSDDLPKAIVIAMPLDLLIYAKQYSKELIAALKKELPKYMILMRRSGEIAPAKTFNPIKSRENMIADMLFPAVVTGRCNEVESREEMRQVVYLESKNQCWSKIELSALEKLLCNCFGQNFKVRVFGSGF